jgi:predicted secreted hydrolase
MPGSTTNFSAATRRSADGQIVRFAQGQIDFAAKRLWRSPSTGISYPIEQELRLGNSHFIVSPLMNEQEINAKGSTGTVYWEGAVTLFDAQNPATPLGQGYLELTGYGERLRLQ